jgi:hypothetical protein
VKPGAYSFHTNMAGYDEFYQVVKAKLQSSVRMAQLLSAGND